MPFKENLKKKILIDRLSTEVLNSIGTSESEKKLDKTAMKALLEMGDFTYKRERDLDLYIEKSESPVSVILVLDNELPIYHSTIADVAMRKSPIIKEMVSIRNAIKILNDGDVKKSKKEASVFYVKEKLMESLDLTYTENDVREIGNEGAGALAAKDEEGIFDCIALYTEMLGLVSMPKTFVPDNVLMMTEIKKQGMRTFFGPILIFDFIDKILLLIDKRLNKDDKDEMRYLSQIVMGNENAPIKGEAVFNFLTDMVLKRRPVVKK